jgi:hypothetical protein
VMISAAVTLVARTRTPPPGVARPLGTDLD